MYTAFSRDQAHKIYVYHKMREYATVLCKTIIDNLDIIRICICGNAKQMPRCVEETFIEILGDYLKDTEKGKVIISNLIKNGQYTVEAW